MERGTVLKAAFWHERWESGRTGFHQSETNRYLVQYWEHLNLTKNAKVFVPLCGKSKDMLWLREQGYEVIGAELSPIAVRDFFAQNNLPASQSNHGPFERWVGEGMTIFCGDVFALSARDLEGVQAIYDRAALIALPPDMRHNYANHLHAILPVNTQTLLVTIDYPQHQRSGPPFSVPNDEVHTLFGKAFDIELLFEEDVKGESERISDKMDYLNERVYLISKKE
jgi:thiopurine S-methyltransferase